MVIEFKSKKQKDLEQKVDNMIAAAKQNPNQMKIQHNVTCPRCGKTFKSEQIMPIRADLCQECENAFIELYDRPDVRPDLIDEDGIVTDAEFENFCNYKPSII